MEVFASLIKSNVIHLFGLVVYGLLLIGLSALGYKIMASVTGFKPAEAQEKQYLLMGIITLGLIIGLSLIISITSYESSPEVVMGSEANIVRQSGGCGAKTAGKPAASGCGQAQKPAQEAVPQENSPKASDKLPSK